MVEPTASSKVQLMAALMATRTVVLMEPLLGPNSAALMVHLMDA